MLYADDIVLLSRNENDLQTMLNHVNNWCQRWLMNVNLKKTKIVHFRKKNIPRSPYIFKYDKKVVDYVKVYKYLGMYFDEHLEFVHNQGELSKAGNRALGSVINKLRMVNV